MKATETKPPINEADRKTTDLCGQEYAGARCTRTRGHPGRHECVYWRGTQLLHWD